MNTTDNKIMYKLIVSDSETVLEIEKWISCFGESVNSATLFELGVLPKEETNQILVYSPLDDPTRRCHLMSNKKNTLQAS